MARKTQSLAQHHAQYLSMALVAGAVAVVARPASADVLFSNFGPDDTYALDIGHSIANGGPIGGGTHEAAMAFTVTGGDYYFDAADVAVQHSWGPDFVHLHLHADDDGAPGQILDSTTASGMTEPFVWSPPMTGEFSGTVVLEAGQQYWLAMAPADTDVLAAWAHNVVDDFGLRAWKIDGQGWQTGYGTPGTDSQTGVYRIHGSLVPAPGALGLLAFALAAARRRR